MNKLMGLIIIGAALIGAATAWRFPFGQNQAANQINSEPQGLVGEPLSQTQVKPANQPKEATAQASVTQKAAQPTTEANQKTAQAPATTTKVQPATETTKTAQAPATTTKAQPANQPNQKIAQAPATKPKTQSSNLTAQKTAQAPAAQPGAGTTRPDETVGEAVMGRW
jgi:cell division protein FtsN